MATGQRWDKGLLLNVGLSLLTEGATAGVARGVGWVADQVNDNFHYLPKEAGIPREVQRARAAALKEKEGEIIFDRGRRSAPLPTDKIPAKPAGAKTIERLSDGTERVIVNGKEMTVVPDIDPAFGVRRGSSGGYGLMKESRVIAINDRTNVESGLEMFTHGDQINGMIRGEEGAKPSYLDDIVYGLGPNGYVGKGTMRDMVELYTGVRITMDQPSSITRLGTIIPIPQGAVGPFPVNSPTGGVQYTRGEGGGVFSNRTWGVRIMNPTSDYPYGRYTYMNKKFQSINPLTGQNVPPDDPWAHIPIQP